MFGLLMPLRWAAASLKIAFSTVCDTFSGGPLCRRIAATTSCGNWSSVDSGVFESFMIGGTSARLSVEQFELVQAI